MIEHDELITLIANEAKITRSKARILYDTLPTRLRVSGNIKLKNFGSFYRKFVVPKQYWNQREGEYQMSHGRVNVSFRPSKYLREIIQGTISPP